jgi:hypothetical protein
MVDPRKRDSEGRVIADEQGSTGGEGFLSLCVRAEEFRGSPISILIYGDPGAGKTHIASTAEAPVVLLTESNGRDTIRRANPDALVFVAESADAVRRFMRAGLGGEFKAAGRRTAVFDSITEVQRLFQDEILAKKPADARTMELQDWGLLTERMRGFCRTLRSLPLDVVATALAEHTVEDAKGAIWSKPAFSGRKLASEVAQYFNAVGYAYKREVRAGSEAEEVDRSKRHAIDFDPDRRVLSKSHSVLSGIVSGCSLADLQRKIHAE